MALHFSRDHSLYGLNQWEMTLQCNVVSLVEPITRMIHVPRKPLLKGRVSQINCLSLTAREVVRMTTSNTASDNKVVTLTNYPLWFHQWCDSHYWKQPQPIQASALTTIDTSKSTVILCTNCGRPSSWGSHTGGWNRAIWGRTLIIRSDSHKILQTHMMTSSNRNIFPVTGHLCGEFTGHRWIPLTKASDVELWCLLWSAPK